MEACGLVLGMGKQGCEFSGSTCCSICLMKRYASQNNEEVFIVLKVTNHSLQLNHHSLQLNLDCRFNCF